MNETEKADDEVDTYHAWDCSPAELTAEIERLKAERDEAVKAEREACAKICDGWTHANGDDCAEAIRARGET